MPRLTDKDTSFVIFFFCIIYMQKIGLEMTTIGLKRPEMVLKWLNMLSKRLETVLE